MNQSGSCLIMALMLLLLLLSHRLRSRNSQHVCCITTPEFYLLRKACIILFIRYDKGIIQITTDVASRKMVRYLHMRGTKNMNFSLYRS
jgi:hypothetical protein